MDDIPIILPDSTGDDAAKKERRGTRSGASAFIARRKLARSLAIKFLYQVDAQKAWDDDWTDKTPFLALVKTAEDPEEDDAPPSEHDIDAAWNGYACAIVDAIIKCHDELDQLIVKAAVNWKLERMGLVDRAILRLAIYEFRFVPNVSPATAINEAIELAKLYGQADSPRFVNGVLDKVRRIVQKNSESNNDEGNAGK